MRDIWVDYNGIHNGNVTTLARFVEEGVDLTVGSTVITGDDEGTTQPGTVVDNDGDLVTIHLLP
jgi:hypothetical protein